MSRGMRRVVSAVHKLTIIAAGIAALAAAAPAHAAAPPLVVTSTPSAGMRYVASADTSIIRVSLSGVRFTLDDTVPLKVGVGCVAVVGDPTNAVCQAPASPSGG